MNPEQLELFRIALLRVLDANGSRFGLGAPALAMLVGQYGFTVKPDDTARELEYLADPALGHVVLVDKKNLSPENRAWKLTAIGRNYLAERGY